MTEKKEEKKSEDVKKSEQQEELEKRYKELFKKVVKVIQEEENVGLVYQVLSDITNQLENEIRSGLDGCAGCGHDCGTCGSGD